MDLYSRIKYDTCLHCVVFQRLSKKRKCNHAFYEVGWNYEIQHFINKLKLPSGICFPVLENPTITCPSPGQSLNQSC